MKPVNPKKANRVLKTSTFSRRQLLSFVILFAIVGAYFLYKSFAAAPLVASMEAEQMVLPAGASVINDTSASGGKAAMIPSVGSATGSVNFPSSVNSVTVMAKAAQCQGSPTMAVVLDGTNLITTAVSSTSWTAYTATPANAIASGTHSYSITFSNDYTKTKGNPRNQCSRTLYLDVSNFYGPTPVATPAPTVTLSASPTTVTAGQASTLTWASTNATSCSASGSWSGTEPTSGSSSTGALNQNATYTLTCTGSGGSASGSANVTVTAATTSSKSIYWGAYVEAANTYNYLYGGTWSNAPWCDAGTQCGLTKYISNVGKAPSIEHWGQCWSCTFDSSIASVVVQRGDIPSIDWRTSGVTNADVAAGKYDSQILTTAKAMAAWGHPLFLEFDVEMNGTWYDYSPGVNGNTAAGFVAMWRHVHDLYVQAGATNVTWVWAPNVDPSHTYTSFSSLYPGDAYVDWTGLDGYNWGNPWQSFAQVFNTSYNDLLSVAPNKPIMINEMASEENGGSKASWITDTFSSQLPNNFTQIKAVQWFNWRIYEKNQYWNWEVESSSASQTAFASAISSPYYSQGGQYGNLPLLSKVQPLP